jgi:hypothetical protein
MIGLLEDYGAMAAAATVILLAWWAGVCVQRWWYG